jgi:hypothetical protein
VCTNLFFVKKLRIKYAKLLFLKNGFNLVYLNQVQHTAGFQRMGKTAQKAGVQQSHILGHGEGGQRGWGQGGAARLQILGGNPMWMAPFGSK